MEIQLKGKVADIINTQVASGEYKDATAFISDIVLKYETYSRKKLEMLNQEIAIGIGQANHGQCIEFNFDEFMEEIDKDLGYIK